MKNNSIKALAREAKQRMRTQAVPEDRGTLPNMVQEEERVWRIVCQLCRQTDIVTDPIRQVADPRLWQQLSGDAKERYILNLSELYVRQLRRFRRQAEC